MYVKEKHYHVVVLMCLIANFPFKMKDFDYYDNTIKLLDMIIISGNYWEPV